MAKPVVALVGRPNVGKSTLFNRIAGERLAVVDEQPGTTRDRLVAEAAWRGIAFDIVDTGGVDPFANAKPSSEVGGSYAPQIRAQAEQAAAEADAVLFLVEVESGLTPADHEVAQILRRTSVRRTRPPAQILLVANRADNAARRVQAVEFFELGLGDPIPVSALHGQGIGDLLDILIERLQASPAPASQESVGLPIAILGRPNVGKSSLVNTLLGEERVIVSPEPGTTRDAIDTHLTYEGRPVTLIDTAGIRRRGRIEPGVEQYSVLRALRAVERSEVGLFVMEAPVGVTAQDAHLAGLIVEKGKSVLTIVNKWDLVSRGETDRTLYAEQIRHRLPFLDYVPILFVSAKTGAHVADILPLAFQVQSERWRT
ncbi:MAG: ribosome biogenesis GTPase Der, partial [Anaerolineales bacterium]